MNVYLTAVSVLALFLQTSICSRYPTVENPYHLNVRLLHLASNRYISVTRDEKGEFQLNTKPFAQIADPDVDFSLYLYSVSEAEEIKVAIVIHQASSSYLSMGSQNDLQLLPMISDNAEELFSFDNPSLISVADTRFFYLRKYKHAYALNFLRGK
ncbi:hypothetical protein C0J52_16286 [Blattella germanica]|nr:hypothetical protein C0J52_16286 [Blattella germanica]